MKRFLPLLLLLLIMPLVSRAQTITANSCNQTDVQTALNSVTASTTTVIIPGGTCSWPGTVTWNVPAVPSLTLTVQGSTTVNCTGTPGTSSYTCSATDLTVIVDNNATVGANSIFQVNMPSGGCGSMLRITGITFQGGPSGVAKNNGIFEIHGPCDNFRFDHSHINTSTYSFSGETGSRYFNELEGVIDHNVFDLGGNSQSNALIMSNNIADPTNNGDTPWASPTSFGSGAALFIEANVSNGGMLTDCDTGGQFTARYNSILNGTTVSSSIHTHGTKSGSGRIRSCRAYEAYHNYINGPSPNANAAIGSGGGPSLVWSNTLAGGYNNFASLATPRNDGEVNSPTPGSWGYAGTAINNNNVGSCYDGNSGGAASGCPNSQAGVTTTGYPTLDGLGRGQGDALSGNFPNVINSVSGLLSWPRQKLEPIYYFCNSILNGANEMVIGENASILNRDVYIDNPTFNGTSGTGCGVLASRPSTVSAGPGGVYGSSPTGSYGPAYFATDANSGNGELYVGTATNTWTPVYQPYAWPHPLESITGQASVVNGSTVFQTIDGFGGENGGPWGWASSPFNWNAMPTGTADQLFSPSAGIGLSVYRSDQADGTSSTLPPDLASMRLAYARGAQIELTMQSPPSSMKYSGNFGDGTPGASGSCLSASPATYATYIAQLIQNIQTAGALTVSWVDVQNEPNATVLESSGFGACQWTGAALDTMVQALHTALVTAGLSTKVILGSAFNYANSANYFGPCIGDSACQSLVSVVSGHGYGYPDLSAVVPGTGGYPALSAGYHMWLGETADQSTTFNGGMLDTAGAYGGLTLAQNIDLFLSTAQVSSYNYWELGYISNGGSCQNCQLIDQSGTVTRRYYVMGNWAKFVRPGQVEISATHSPQAGVLVTAFKNTSTGAFEIVAINTTGTAVSQPFTLQNLSAASVTPWLTDPSNGLVQQANITISSGSFTTNLTPNSVTTFVSNAAAPSFTFATATVPANAGTVSCNPIAGSYVSGTPVTCTQTTNPGFTFTAFSGLCTGATCSFNLSSSGTVVANYTATTGGSCTQLGSTYTAASCNYVDVNSCVNGPGHTVVNGDTVVIPACTGGVTWTQSLVPPQGVAFTLTGTGTPNTTPSTYGAGTLQTKIIDAATSTGLPMINVTGLQVGNNVMRISTLQIEPTTSTALISPINISGTCSSTTCPQFRVDNIGFGLSTPWVEANVGVLATALVRTDNVFGVLDHNTNANGNFSEFVSTNNSAYLGVGLFGDNSWAQPDSTGTANATFVENNLLYVGNTVTETEFGAYGGGIGGARVVGRFNQIIFEPNGFVAFSGHGLESDGRPRGIRQIEGYNNTVSCPTAGAACNTAVTSYRSGGTGYTFNNNISVVATSDFGSIFTVNIYRTIFTASPWGACGGSGPWDINDGIRYYSGIVTTASNPSPNFGWNLTMQDTTQSWLTNQFIPVGAPFSVHDITQGWWGEIQSNTGTTDPTPNTITVDESIGTQNVYGFKTGDHYEILRATVCGDQPGRGAGLLLTGQSPTPVAPFNEALDPIYEWNDPVTTGVFAVVASNTLRLIGNRDYFAESMNQGAQTSPTSPFNGTSGTGHGTLANRPVCASGCTVGVGYWATDQGNWNQSGLACTGNGAGVGQGCQGQLYVWNGTTWVLRPGPYTYPHPLVSGGASTFAWTPTVSPSNAGTITGMNASPGNYTSGQQIGPITANANPGYTFSGWSSATGNATCSGTTNPCPQFNISSPSGVIANFTPVLPVCGDPTPNSPNTPGVYNVPPTPLPLVVGYISPTPNCGMVFTSDGTAPACGGTPYPAGGFSLTTTTDISVLACQNGYTPSNVVSKVWTINVIHQPLSLSGTTISLLGSVSVAK